MEKGKLGEPQRSCLIELIEFVFYSRPHASDKKSLRQADVEGVGSREADINDEGWSERARKKKRKYVLNGLFGLACLPPAGIKNYDISCNIFCTGLCGEKLPNVIIALLLAGCQMPQGAVPCCT